MKKTINKFYVTLLLLFVLLSCAQPKYIKNEGPSSPNSLQQEGQADCSLQLSSSKICVSWKWEVLPTASTMGSLILKTYRLNMFDQKAGIQKKKRKFRRLKATPVYLDTFQASI